MAIPPDKLAQVIISGGVANGERWSCGHWRLFESSTATPTPAQINTYANDVLTATQAQLWSSAVAGTDLHDINDAGTTLDTVTVRWYELGLNIRTGQAAQVASGGVGTTTHPGYVALVVTLRTDLPGRARRGRMYLPGTSLPLVGNTHQVSSTTCSDLLAKVRAWWINSGFGPGWDPGKSQAPVVMSSSTSSVQLITSLAMDTLPDTQHGRTRSMIATARPSLAFP